MSGCRAVDAGGRRERTTIRTKAQLFAEKSEKGTCERVTFSQGCHRLLIQAVRASIGSRSYVAKCASWRGRKCQEQHHRDSTRE
jgi:hypothetical protein